MFPGLKSGSLLDVIEFLLELFLRLVDELILLHLSTKIGMALCGLVLIMA